MRKIFTFVFSSLLFSLISFSQSKGLNFDGVNDYVTIPDRAGVLTGSAFTFETWVKPNGGFSANAPVIHKMNAAYDRGLDVYFYGNNGINGLEIDLYTNTGLYFIGYNLPAGWVTAWHHLALTYNGSIMQLFIDGTLINSTPATGSLTVTGSTANLGYIDPGNPGFFPGTLDELRIWNIARTQAEIQASMNTEIPATTPGLTANYRFNQGTANGNNTAITTIVDQIAGNSGTLVNFARTGTTSNFVGGYVSLTVLALKDASFTAIKKEDGVQLDWKSTASQEPTLFTVERSANGLAFSSLARINAPASTTEAAHSFTDRTPLLSVGYYRIKSTDADGHIAYSKTIAVAIDKIVAGLQVYPNPASSAVQFQVPKNVALIEIKDLGGRTVQAMQITPQGNAVSTTMDISKLAKGMYIVTTGSSSVLLIKQ